MHSFFPRFSELMMTVEMEKNYAWYTEHVLWCFVVSTIIQTASLN